MADAKTHTLELTHEQHQTVLNAGLAALFGGTTDTPAEVGKPATPTPAADERTVKVGELKRRIAEGTRYYADNQKVTVADVKRQLDALVASL